MTLRAPRHVDYIESVDIQGAGASQDLKAVLQASWGTLKSRRFRQAHTSRWMELKAE